MELQFNQVSVKSLNTAIRDVRNTELTQEVRIPDGMPDIGRVLTSWGQVVLRSKQWQNDTVSISGGVKVWILYVPEDGTEVRSTEVWIPLQMKWELPEVVREGPMRVLPLLRFVDSRGTSARKMMVRAGVSAMAEAMYPAQTDTYEAPEVPEDVELLRRTYPVRLPREGGEKTFLIDEEITAPGAAPAMEKLLAYTVNPEITERKVLANKVVFRGNTNLHTVYRDGEGKVHSWDFEVPFSQYTELDEIYGPDAQADIQMAVTDLELDMSEPGRLRMKCGLVAQYLVDDRQLLELTADAYSPLRDVEMISQELTLPVILDDRKETLTAEQMIPGQNGQAVDVNFLPDFPRQRRTADGVELEIPALFQMLFYAEDGSLQAANARWEGNMLLPSDENSNTDVWIQPIGRGQAAPGVDGLSVMGNAQLRMMTGTSQGIPMVTGLELGQLHEPDPTRPSLILCRTEGDSLWEVAKRCGSTMNSIRTANGFEGEPASDRMLLIPVS